MTLQGRNIEIQYAQYHKSPLGTRLADCQKCTQYDSDAFPIPAASVMFEPINHHYFDENICQTMITAYVDRCSYNHQGVLKACAGIIWLNDNPCPPQQFNLGPTDDIISLSKLYPTLQDLTISPPDSNVSTDEPHFLPGSAFQ